MTEAEWLVSDNSEEMYKCLREQHGVSRRKVGKRKVRLFGCASCRLYGTALSDPRSLAAVEYMERFADGVADPAQMDMIREQARLALDDAVRLPNPAGATLNERPWRAAAAAFDVVGVRGAAYLHWGMRTTVGGGNMTEWREWMAARRALAALLRDIFGNPFHPHAITKAWRTDTALALARQMYEARDFSAMPILADAIQDAGCDNDDILNHCRSSGAHVRGCWVVDSVLGKD
jgi:hypothetical protein